MATFALLGGLAFVSWLFARDMRWRRLPSPALWIPGIWLALGSSRALSFWLAQIGLAGQQTNRLEGNPVNVLFNGGLFLAAVLVLNGRRFSWADYAQANKPLFALYAFFLCSALWSPFPLPTVRRLVQEFGWILMAPIVLTEKERAAALRLLFVRVSYVLFPLSVVFMRYFPRIGRGVSEASGAQLLSGVADHKNSLGQLCMVFCLVLLWDLLETRKSTKSTGLTSRRPEGGPRLVALAIGLYLLIVCGSATSLLCFLFGLALLLLGRRLATMKDPTRVFMLGMVAVVIVLTVNAAYETSARVSEALGRGSGMSGRSLIWQTVMEKNTDYLIGAGFRGFWETEAGRSVFHDLEMGELITAHNGYLETYLNGGVVGLFLLALFIWFTGLTTTRKLVGGDPIGRLAVVFWPIVLVYNVTESQFLYTGPVWFAMLLVTIDAPRRGVGREARSCVARARQYDCSGVREEVARPLSARCVQVAVQGLRRDAQRGAARLFHVR